MAGLVGFARLTGVGYSLSLEELVEGAAKRNRCKITRDYLTHTAQEDEHWARKRHWARKQHWARKRRRPDVE